MHVTHIAKTVSFFFRAVIKGGTANLYFSAFRPLRHNSCVRKARKAFIFFRKEDCLHAVASPLWTTHLDITTNFLLKGANYK